MPAVDRRALLLAGLGGLSAIGAGTRAVSATGYADPDVLYAALRDQPATILAVGDRRIRVVFADGAPGLHRPPVLAWIRRCAQALVGYFGQLPVADYGLLIMAEPGDRVGHATTFGYAGSATRIGVGTGAGRAAFADDWVLVHEMFHTALPDLPRRALWLQEGNATWLEPVARAAAGQLPATEVWRQAVAGMSTGEPQSGDGGMDGTTVHDRLYWGGATFWLLAEIAIQQKSGGRHRLRDAMRAVNRMSGGNAADWAPDMLMASGDRATDTDALATLYDTFARQPIRTDLPDLFQRLGVVGDGRGVRFDEHAPLAAIRRRITAP